MKAIHAAVQLRAPVRGDFAFLTALRNDPSLQRQLLLRIAAYSPNEVRAWLRRRMRDPHGAFFVIAAPDDRPLGFVQLTQMDSVNGTADFGICLGVESQGRGVAVAALKLLEARARREFKLRKLTLRVLTTNRRAIAFYRKAGFCEVGAWRRHFLQDGKFRDVLLMEKFIRVSKGGGG